MINMAETIRDTALHFTQFGYALIALSEETATAINESMKQRGFDCEAFEREGAITRANDANPDHWCVRFSKATDLHAAQDAVDCWNRSLDPGA
jgi:hypothetical protein